MSENRVDVAVVGGGVGGLAAAALLAGAGKSVRLFEKAPRLGGRAITQDVGGFRFNLGPHALYRAGSGLRVLRRLGIEPRGGVPGVSGGFALRGGARHALPGGFLSLVSTGLFGLAAKLETARLLAGIARIDAARYDGEALTSWLEREIRHPEVRLLIGALVRLATYANCPDRLSAGVALRQLQQAVGGSVLYLDGGWQTMVDALRDVATAAGARLAEQSRVDAVTADQNGWLLRPSAGSPVAAAAVVLAVEPQVAAALTAGSAGATLAAWAAAAEPVRAACLDVGLKRLPQPRALFALGVDAPVYLSVHSAVARLAEGERASVQVAKYLPVGAASDAKTDQRQLEGVLDLVQPGWRGELLEQRFLPDMVVSHALTGAASGGCAGRPGPAVNGADGLFVVGDWVGAEGLLADASFASAECAANAILARPADKRAAA